MSGEIHSRRLRGWHRKVGYQTSTRTVSALMAFAIGGWIELLVIAAILGWAIRLLRCCDQPAASRKCGQHLRSSGPPDSAKGRYSLEQCGASSCLLRREKHRHRSVTAPARRPASGPFRLVAARHSRLQVVSRKFPREPESGHF